MVGLVHKIAYISPSSIHCKKRLKIFPCVCYLLGEGTAGRVDHLQGEVEGGHPMRVVGLTGVHALLASEYKKTG